MSDSKFWLIFFAMLFSAAASTVFFIAEYNQNQTEQMIEAGYTYRPFTPAGWTKEAK